MSASTTSNQARAVNFLQSGSGAIATNLQSRGRDTYHVFDWFSAAQIADVRAGTTLIDVTSSVQAAIDAVNTAGGGTLFFPAGDYRMASGLALPAYSNVHMVGAGPNATSLWVINNNTKVFNITGLATRISIENMWLGAGSALTGCVGIEVTGTDSSNPASEIYINKVNIQNMNNCVKWTHVHQSKMDWVRAIQSVVSGITGNGFYLFGVVSSRLNDLQVLASAGSIGGEYFLIDGDCDTVVLNACEGYGGTTNIGFRCQLGSGTTGPRLTRLINCYAEICTSDGFAVTAGRDIRFEGCHAAANSENGFEITGGDSVVLQDCLALQNNKYGFIVTGGAGVGIINCTASDNSQTTDNTYDGIRIEANVTHARVIGCRSGDFIFSLTNDQRYGVSLGAGTSDYLVCKDNDCQGNQTGDIGNFSTGTSNDIDQDGTFTATLTGFATPPTGTARFRREGRVVRCYIPALSGTSNATTCTITGVPTDIRPQRDQEFPVLITDNGTNAFGWASLASSGTITLAPSAANSASGWTGSGTKTFAEQTLGWSLD